MPSRAPPCPAPLTPRESPAADILEQVFGEVTPRKPATPQMSSPSLSPSPVKSVTRALSLAPAPTTEIPAISQSRSLPTRPLSQTDMTSSRERQPDPETDPIPLLQPIRPSSSRSRRSFESEKTVTGRGKAGKFNMKSDMNKFNEGPEIAADKESIKDKWKQWNIQHQAKVKKEVSRLVRSGNGDIVCKICRRSISSEKWFKHRTIYNYCKPGDKYLKFDNFKRDYPMIDSDI